MGEFRVIGLYWFGITVVNAVQYDNALAYIFTNRRHELASPKSSNFVDGWGKDFSNSQVQKQVFSIFSDYYTEVIVSITPI